jgi:hypothetical protein
VSSITEKNPQKTTDIREIDANGGHNGLTVASIFCISS